MLNVPSLLLKCCYRKWPICAVTQPSISAEAVWGLFAAAGAATMQGRAARHVLTSSCCRAKASLISAILKLTLLFSSTFPSVLSSSLITSNHGLIAAISVFILSLLLLSSRASLFLVSEVVTREATVLFPDNRSHLSSREGVILQHV